MMKFKVGDKVRIKDNLQYTQGIGESTIAEYRDKVCTISRVSESGNICKLMEDKVGFDWLTSMLEPVEAEKKLKFNVGDKVRIRKDLVVDEKYNNITFLSGMDILAWANRVYTIERVDEDSVRLKNELFWWGEDMLEPVETIKEDDKLEMVNHPQHYAFKYEPIDVINDWGLDFNLGNTVKYIARCERKGNKIQDLEKAKFYLEDEIRRLKENE